MILWVTNSGDYLVTGSDDYIEFNDSSYDNLIQTSASISIGKIGSGGNISQFQINDGGVGFILPPTITVNSRNGFGLVATGVLGGVLPVYTFAQSNTDLLTLVILTTLDISVYENAVKKLVQPAGTQLAAINSYISSTIISSARTSKSYDYALVVQPYVSLLNVLSVLSKVPVIYTPRYLFISDLWGPGLQLTDGSVLSLMIGSNLGIGSSSSFSCGDFDEESMLDVCSSSTSNTSGAIYRGIFIEKMTNQIIIFTDRNPTSGSLSDTDTGKFAVLRDTILGKVVNNVKGVS